MRFPRLPESGWRRNLLALWISEFLAMVGVSLVIPFIPLYVRHLGVGELHDVQRWSGILFAAPFLVSSLVTPLWGALGDRYGQKLMVVRAVFGLFLATTLMAFATSVEQFFFLRLLQGAISGFVASALALMAASAPRERLGYALGTLATAITAGSVVGPFLGGILADLIGYRGLFLVTAGLNLAATFLVASWVEEAVRPTGERRTPSPLSNFVFVLRSPHLRWIIFLMLLSSVAIRSIEPTFVLFVEELAPRSSFLPTLAGGLLAATGIASLASAPRWGKRGDQRGYRRALRVSLLGGGVFLGLQGIARAVPQLLFLRIAFGVFLAGVIPIFQAMVGRYVPEERRGGTLAFATSALMVGNILGPLSGGFLAPHVGIRVVFLLAGTLLVLTALLVHLAIREESPHPAPLPGLSRTAEPAVASASGVRPAAETIEPAGSSSIESVASR